jgi:flagellar motor switch protein FliM
MLVDPAQAVCKVVDMGSHGPLQGTRVPLPERLMRQRHPTPPAASPQPLDPRTLGRPVHLLAGFCEDVRTELAAFLQTRLNRRYASGFRVGEVTLAPFAESLRARRWYVAGGETGVLGCSLDRRIALAVLGYRYGMPATTPAWNAGTDVRETATEERLTHVLGQQLLRLVAEQIDREPAAALPDAAPAPAGFAHGAELARSGTWLLRAALKDSAQEAEGLLYVLIDAGWMGRLLSRLAAERRTAPRARPAPVPLVRHLQLRLSARLVQQQMQLGELVDLRVGDILPITMGRTGVFVDEARLFDAAVAEHQGRLCLTSFEDAD